MKMIDANNFIYVGPTVPLGGEVLCAVFLFYFHFLTLYIFI